MISLAVRRLAFATEVSRLGGAPALTIASLMTCIVSSVQSRAFGCGLKTTAFPADSITIAWLITVDVGFVVGVIELITPNGTYSIRSVPKSPDIASDIRSSTPGESVTAPSFFIILCAALPMLVSCTAKSARRFAFASEASLIASMISRLLANPSLTNAACAVFRGCDSL